MKTTSPDETLRASRYGFAVPSFGRTGRLAMALAVLLGVGAVRTAQAQPSTDKAASVLVFPLYDSRDTTDTILSITNTNTSSEYCEEADTRAGDVRLHFQYIDGDTWADFPRFEHLTPGDTLSVLTSQHNPEWSYGFVVVTAFSPVDSSQAISFDWLIGSATVVRADMDRAWSYRPCGFRAIADRTDPCEYVDTDFDVDSARDFDGEEYERFPRRLRLASFLSKNESFDNRIALLTLASSIHQAETEFVIWNNIEQKFSRTLQFSVFFEGDLSEISQIVRDLDGNRDEIGFLDIESGWIEIEGTRILDAAGNPVLNRGGGPAIPPILAVYGGSAAGTDAAYGHALHFDGVLDGLEFGMGDRDPQEADPIQAVGTGR